MIRRMGQDRAQLPQSATHGLVAFAGLAAFLGTAVLIRAYLPFGSDLMRSALAIILVTSAAIFAVDVAWQKVHRRPSTGLDFTRDDPSWSRTLVKLAGLLGSIGFVGLGYWLFPQYDGKQFANFFDLLRLTLPLWLVLAVPYFHWVDRRMREPRDGYWHMGKLLMLQWHAVDGKVVGQHMLGWLIKGFFVALMFTYMCADLDRFLQFAIGPATSARDYFQFVYWTLFFVDVGLASLGYIMSFRVTDTHIRSAEPTMLGWLVALACYEPFWSLVGRQYLAYDSGYRWSAWLAGQPVLQVAWGGAILALTAIYVWATVMFGARFSNLTHRGILTNGPYRWTKHPAYLAKNLSWWLYAVPFVPVGTWKETLGRCLMLLGLNLIYVMRAKTEEWHLSRDHDYVQYALWMEQNGALRFIRKVPVLRWLAYRAPTANPATSA
jgi:protein-S-isoprenylcysteine O-methyltransferase Ste14